MWRAARHGGEHPGPEAGIAAAEEPAARRGNDEAVMADEVVMNATEIARLAGVTRGTVLTWRRQRDDFPAPVGSALAGAVYNGTEVEAWLAAAGLWELAPGPRVWREVSHGVQGGSLGEAVGDAAAAAARQGNGEALPPSVPGNLAWLIKGAVDSVGAAAVLNDLLDRYAAASGIFRPGRETPPHEDASSPPLT